MKTVKVKLVYQADKPVNFKFGEVNIRVGIKPSIVEEHYAKLIMEQFPGWIEQVVKPARKSKTIKTEA